MRRKSAALAWLPLALAACATSSSQPECPPPYEEVAPVLALWRALVAPKGEARS